LAIFANKDTGHPHGPFTAARTGEAPAPLGPGDIALDVDVDVIGYRLDVVPAAYGGTASTTCLLVHHSSVSVPT